jgi:hypothetical protein
VHLAYRALVACDRDGINGCPPTGGLPSLTINSLAD